MSLGQFAQDIKEGLSAKPKKLSSKYFYDNNGDKLFQQIMKLDEYYLSRAELEVFELHKEALLLLMNGAEDFRILELGAGDGAKTKVLLKHFQESGAKFTYAPVDISGNVLDVLKKNMQADIPNLSITPLAGDYFEVLGGQKFQNDQRSIVFFLGSNIGNFSNDIAVSFLSSIHSNMRKGDLLMIGFDLKKNPRTILKAYDDSQGVTKAFNLNLLTRINNQLGGDFDLTKFDHNPIYDPMTGECRSYLISKEKVEVTIEKLGQSYSFEPWEPIFMEVSKKYDVTEIEELAKKAGFKLVQNFFDSNRLFCDSVLEVI